MIQTQKAIKVKEILTNPQYTLSATLTQSDLLLKLINHGPIQQKGTYVSKIQSLDECGKFGQAIKDFEEILEFLNQKTVKYIREHNFLVLTPSFGVKPILEATLVFLTREEFDNSFLKEQCQQMKQVIQNPSIRNDDCFSTSILDLKLKSLSLINSIGWLTGDRYYFNDKAFMINRLEACSDQNFEFNGTAILTGKFSLTFVVNSSPKWGKIIFGIRDEQNISRRNKQITAQGTGQLFGFNHPTNNPEYAQRDISYGRICRFRRGNVVTMTGDIKKSSIQFRANGLLIQKKKCQIMTDQTIKQVPYVHLTFNSSVSITESFPYADMVPVFLASGWFSWDYDILYQMNNLLVENENDSECENGNHKDEKFYTEWSSDSDD